MTRLCSVMEVASSNHVTVPCSFFDLFFFKLFIDSIVWILYKYYIPCAGDSRKYHPRNVIINRGAAEVDNHISRDDIFDYHPSRKCNIYFIIPNRTLDPLFSEVLLSWRGEIQIENNKQPLIYMLEWNQTFTKMVSFLRNWMLDLITDVPFNKWRHKSWWRQT